MESFEEAGVFGGLDAKGTGYVEHLHRPDLSLGTYSLRAGAEDPQEPLNLDRAVVEKPIPTAFTRPVILNIISYGIMAL